MAATMDGTTNSSSAGQLAVEHVCVDDIGTQLINIESVMQTIREQALLLGTSGMETSALELKSLLPKLGDVQISLRKTFGAHARLLIRDLHVFDLPDELLRNVFQHVAGGLETKGDHGIVVRSDVGSIKSCRLVCHRFCDTSSHLLLWQLDVSITNSSLARLEEVSHHPTISLGVKSLRVCAGLFDSSTATTFRGFEVEAATAMRGALAWGMELVNMPRQSQLQHRAEGHSQILRAIKEHVTGSSGRDEDEIVVAIRRATRRAYDRYKQLLIDQKVLLQGNTFFRKVATAVVRMPTITELSIHDGALGSRDPWTRNLSPIDQLVQNSLIKPHQNWSLNICEQLVQPSVDFLFQLPLDVDRAGSFLTALHIKFTPALDFKLNLGEEEVRNVLQMAQHLRALSIECSSYEYDDGLGQPSGQNLPKLVRLLLQAPSLREVDINFQGVEPDEHQGSNIDYESVGGSVSLLPWTKLCKVSLSWVSICFDEFATCLEQLEPGACIVLANVDLLTGTWADLLDVLRTKANCASSVWSPTGGEEDEHPEWYGHFLTLDEEESLATQYIRGILSENPLRDHFGSDAEQAEEPQL